MTTSFFISDHGFGHLMRELPVILELLKQNHQVILICGEKHIQLAKEYLNTELGYVAPVQYIACHTDAGIVVKAGTIALDHEATKQAVAKFIQEFPERINFAKQVFSDYKVDRVVVDIVPWALHAAKEAGIKSYIMASFTWIEQYEGYVDEALLEILRGAFQSADEVLYYNLVNEPTKHLLGDGTPVGFVAREFHDDKVREIVRQFKNDGRELVYLSLGASNSGLDFEIDVSGLPYEFIATKALQLKGDNVHYLDVSVPNTQDYVKASDYCIAKSGWGTVAEALLAGVKFAVLNRPDVPEDTMIIDQLVNRNKAIAIDVEELKNLGQVIDKMKQAKWNETPYDNKAFEIAQLIVK